MFFSRSYPMARFSLRRSRVCKVTQNSQVIQGLPAQSHQHKQIKYDGGDPSPQHPDRLSLLHEDNNTLVASSVMTTAMATRRTIWFFRSICI